MGHCGARQVLAAQHAGDLGHALLTQHRRHAAFSARAHALLGHHQMVIGTGGDLGQVGHGQHLAVSPELLHQAAHGLGHGAAHARVDLVKNQGLCGAQLAGGDRNGQGHA